jgi:hypothetical protein
MKKIGFAFTLMSLLFLAGMEQEAGAQVAGHNLGIGGQLGDPSGLAIKWYRSGSGGSLNFRAWDFLFAWDTDDDVDRFFVNAHGLFERPISTVPLDFYYGPGLFIGLVERDPGDDGVYLGISGNFGISYEIDRFDIFLQLTPRLALAPDTDGDLGGGIGARFWL